MASFPAAAVAALCLSIRCADALQIQQTPAEDALERNNGSAASTLTPHTGGSIPQAETHDFFYALDADHDGLLTRGEFAALGSSDEAAQHQETEVMVARRRKAALGEELEKDKDPVCVSVAAYEGPEFIDLLIANVLKFAEGETKVAIHLNNQSHYDEEDLNRWESDRVTITQHRVPVRPFRGSVFYAHILNANQMKTKWGDYCRFFVVQASNMMWVRHGMERVVRLHKFSPIPEYKEAPSCYNDYTDPNRSAYTSFTAKIVEPTGMYSTAAPEGAFYPFWHVVKFWTMLQGHLRDIGQNETSIWDARCYFENVWLPTYMLNYANPPDETKNATYTKLCFTRDMDYGTNKNKREDSVSWQNLQSVIAGEGEYEGWFAVKRVNRDLAHPITKLIARLSEYIIPEE